MKRLRGFIVLAAALAAVTVALSAPAAAQGARYFILIGGTCDPTASYYNGIDLRGGIALPVHYPAAGNPTCSDVGTSYDASVAAGHLAAREKLEQAYRDDPGGQFVVVGFSQGAHVGNLVLNDVADGRTSVPKQQVGGSLYGDPMHPVTGLGAVVPRGWSLFGFTSPGPGRDDFGGMPVERYCIETDGICDTSSIESVGGYFVQHPCYGRHVMPHTLADGINHGNHRWDRVC